MNMTSVTIAEPLSAAPRSDELRTCFLITPLALGVRGSNKKHGAKRSLQTKENRNSKFLSRSPKRAGKDPAGGRNHALREDEEEQHNLSEPLWLQCRRIVHPISTFVRIALGPTALTIVDHSMKLVPPT